MPERVWGFKSPLAHNTDPCRRLKVSDHSRPTAAKPAGLAAKYGQQFADAAVVENYRFRPAYPPELFDMLTSLAVGDRSSVLEVGCGTGDLTFGLAGRFDRVRAIDPSEAMISEARRRDIDARISWSLDTMETVAINERFDLVVAAESLHWTEWATTLPAIAASLAEGGVLAIIERATETPRWQRDLLAIIGRYSTNRDYRPYELVQELEDRALFRPHGSWHSPLHELSQPVDDYVASFYSRNGLSPERLDPGAKARFADELHVLLRAHDQVPAVNLCVGATMSWGSPAPRS
ncbi:MAG: hypothetical protein DHS20C19_13680 [Acidimicrobiales bacterium]|nr:MAG: hypothetical protein DHS20C19_13680 [Acidimicrobiales bacterium]